MSEATKQTKPAFKDISQVLHFIQINLKAPKNQVNTFGKYKYRSCEDIVEAVKAVLPEGATLRLSDEVVVIGDRYYVKATASLCFAGACESVTAYARETHEKKGMDDAQLTGSTSSYARKYALNGLLLIDDTKDADTQDNRTEEKKPEAKPEPKAAKVAKPEKTPQVIKIEGWRDQIKACETYEEILELSRRIIPDAKDLSLEQLNYVNDLINKKQDALK